MKKIPNLFLSVLILISANFVFAQDLKLGFIAGVDLTNIRFEKNNDYFNGSIPDFKHIISYNANGYIGYKSNSFWGLSFEPGYIKKGGDFTDFNSRYTFSYIQLPVLADLYISDKFFISIGPELGYLVKAKFENNDLSMDILDRCDNRFELSGLLGINYSIFKNTEIALRYSYGLTYTAKTFFSDNYGNQLRQYNHYIQFILRFKILTGIIKI